MSLAQACYQLAYDSKVTQSRSPVPKFTFCFMNSGFYIKFNIMALIKLLRNYCFSQHVLTKIINPSECYNQRIMKEMKISHHTLQEENTNLSSYCTVS